jgi:ribonuclease-3
MTKLLDQLQQQLSYTFDDPSLCIQALTHRSYGSVNNERLEFLGDAILDLLIGEYFYRLYPSATEGELSSLRAMAVCGEKLATIGQQLQLGECLYIGAGEVGSGGRQRQSSIANALEALIAAVYLDGGVERCRDVTMRLFLGSLDNMTPGDGKDAKTALQEYLQSRQMALPLYTLVYREGGDHEARFTMECSVTALGIKADAIASSRKKAEQLAAEKIMRQLESGK